MNKEEGPDTAVAKLISTLENKLVRASNLDTRTIRAAILEAGMQISYQHMCYYTGVDNHLGMNNYSDEFPYYLDADAQHNKKDNSSAKYLIQVLSQQIVICSRVKSAAKYLFKN
jgi:hypothetical protein